jgi:hypothetical protein
MLEFAFSCVVIFLLRFATVSLLWDVERGLGKLAYEKKGIGICFLIATLLITGFCSNRALDG